MTTEWGLRLADGTVMPCTSERHARGLMTSTSVVLGSFAGRSVVCRGVSEWVEP